MQDFEEMLGNVLDNARKWARSAVNITASCSILPNGEPGCLKTTGEGLQQGRSRQHPAFNTIRRDQ
jgi:hypothetical protein